MINAAKGASPLQQFLGKKAEGAGNTAPSVPPAQEPVVNKEETKQTIVKGSEKMLKQVAPKFYFYSIRPGLGVILGKERIKFNGNYGETDSVAMKEHLLKSYAKYVSEIPPEQAPQ